LWFNINATNLSDLMDNAHVTWKSYQEEYVPLPGGMYRIIQATAYHRSVHTETVTATEMDDNLQIYPISLSLNIHMHTNIVIGIAMDVCLTGACDNGMGIGYTDKSPYASGTQLYQRKHNPPMLYTSVNSNISRCQNIVSEAQFISDVLSGNMPQVSFYTPNIVDDGHDTDSEGDSRTTSSAFWVKQFLTSYLPYLQQQNVLVQLTFDESDYPNTINTPLYPVANQVVSILYGPSSLITPNTTYSGFINHYGVLDAIEQNFALGSLLRNDSLPANGGQNFFDALNKANQKAGQFYSINATGIA
jgi:hypothetical protein